MPNPTSALRALPVQPVRIGVVNALKANGQLISLVWAGGAAPVRIYPDDDVAQDAYPLITHSVTSAVPDYDYASSRIVALVTVTAVDRGPATANTALLESLIQLALVDTSWAIPGYAMVDRRVETVRPYTQVVDAAVFRYVAVGVRITATRIQ